MSYAIDTEGAGRVGSTLRITGAALRDAAAGFAHVGGSARAGVGGHQPLLGGALDRFVDAQLRELSTYSLGFDALGHALSWSGMSALAVELANARALGAAGSGPVVRVAG